MKNMIPLFSLSRAGVLLTLALVSTSVQAASGNPPDLMTYQGYLVDNNGTPLGNTAPKNYDVVFRIWKDQLSTATGDRLWAEQQTITIDKGYFSVLLGEGAECSGEPRPALSTLFVGAGASDRFIEVMVKGIGAGGTDVTITPRLRLLTSPYAFLTQTAVNAQNLIGGGTNLTSLNANSLTSGTVADARLSANVAKLNATQTFTGTNTFAGNVTVGGDLQIGTSSADYQHLQLGGGNSWGYLYGSYPALGDGIHLGYNYYYDAAGVGHLTRSGGATSRLTLGYGKIELATDGNDAAPSTRLLVNASGYVGIGTTSPGFPLNFPNTLGDKISLWGNSGNHYGLGVQSGTLQIHGDVSTSKVVFGYGQSTNLTETMRIQGNGNVGIGTTTPAGKLDVNGTIKVAGDAPIQIKTYTLPNIAAASTGGTIVTTTYPTNTWSAVVVGWSLEADIRESNSGQYAVRALKGLPLLLLNPATNWGVYAAFHHQGTDVININVDVMFIRKEMVNDMR